MADDFDIDAVIAQHAAGPFVPGKSTKRTIAAPETGPGTTIPAEDFDVDALATDAGPTARRAAAGKPPEPAVGPDDTGSLDMRDVERERRLQADTDNNPFAGDPLARMIATGLVGGGAGSLAGAGAAALGAGPVVAGTVTGAAGGAATTALQGGSAKDIALGAALGGGLGALPPILQGAAKRTAERTFQEYANAAKGAGKQKTLEKLRGIDADEVADVLHRNGIGSVKDGAGAEAATNAAIASTGQQMGHALDVIDAAPGGVTLGDAMGKLEGLRKQLAGDEATRPLAESLHKYMRDFWEANGAKKDAVMTANALHGKVSGLQAKGYAGTAANLSPASAKVLARQTAGALDELLDDRIAAAAKGNPAAAEAAKTLEDLTRDYRVLKTIQPITKAQAIAQRFAPSASARFSDALAHPVRSAAKVAIAPVVGAPAAVAGAVDRALARLYSAPVVTPDLVNEALNSGVAPASIAAIASMRKARAAAAPVAPLVPATP